MKSTIGKLIVNLWHIITMLNAKYAKKQAKMKLRFIFERNRKLNRQKRLYLSRNDWNNLFCALLISLSLDSDETRLSDGCVLILLCTYMKHIGKWNVA